MMQLALIDTSTDVVLQREQAMEQRRRDQVAHRHDTIWTKDAHGGPYRKVPTRASRCCQTWADTHMQADNRQGYDALRQTPEGRSLPVALGYEAPQKGCTTNFVGNHMTAVRAGLAACTACMPLH